MAMATTARSRVNGLDMDALAGVIREIAQNPAKGLVESA